MDRDLEKLPSSSNDLLAVADYYARDAQAQCTDVSVMAFASGHLPPSDEMLAAVGMKLRALVRAIENAICGQSENKQAGDPKTWPLLFKSGFLKEPSLIDFLLARFAEDRLQRRIAKNGDNPVTGQLPAILLSSSDSDVADAAQAILASESMARHSSALLHRELSAESLHQLVWRIVAALQIYEGAKNPDHISRAKELLAQHDEAQSGRVAARKLEHLLPEQYHLAALNPEKAGLSLFIAALCARTNLDHDHILRLCDGHSSTPLAIILRACSLPRDDAMAIICLFKGFDLTPLEVTIFDTQYENMEQETALAETAKWSNAHAKYLAFPNMAQGLGE